MISISRGKPVAFEYCYLPPNTLTIASQTNLYWLWKKMFREIEKSSYFAPKDWSRLVLTEVWISMARWSRIWRTISSGYTGWLASIKHMAVSIVISTPVRPMPALQWTIVGSVMPLRRWRTRCTKSRKSLASSGTPWSGHEMYCICVMWRSLFELCTRTSYSSQNRISTRVV